MARRIRAREVLRLRSVNGLSQNAIARTAHVSKHSVQDVLEAARERGVSWEDVEGMSEEAAYALLFPGRGDAGPVHADPDWARVHRELARTGVTLKLLHAEYADGCAEAGAPSMSYDRFCKRYRQYTVSRNVVSRVGHKAGRNMEVDWSGPTMRLVDPATGEVRKVYLFVACLPFSRYSYVEPTLDMKQDTWLLCHVHAFSFLGGATPCIVPDNLRTGVTAHPRAGEPVLNAAYEELAAHYGSAVIPARVRRPRDKPSAENEVWAAATYVIAALRDEAFTDMAALRAAVARRVAEHNDAPFAKREGSRREVFEEVEQPAAEAPTGRALRGVRVGLRPQGPGQLPRRVRPQLLLGEPPARRLDGRPARHRGQGGGLLRRRARGHAPQVPVLREEPLLHARLGHARGQGVVGLGRAAHPRLGLEGRALLLRAGGQGVRLLRVRRAGLQRRARRAQAVQALHPGEARAGVRDGARDREEVAALPRRRARAEVGAGQGASRRGVRGLRLRARRRLLRGGVSMDVNAETARKLREMGAAELLAALSAQDEAVCAGMAFAERVQMAVDEAHSDFITQKVRNLTRRAGLRYPEADVRSVDFFEGRGLDRVAVAELATCGFVGRGENVVLQGLTGTGKTYLACALAKAACARRVRSCYVRQPDLEDLWRESRDRPGGERKLVRKYGAFGLLVIDEWLLDRPDTEFRSMLLELMELRYGTASTVFCTQFKKKDWHPRLSGGVHADAIMDRIVHNAVWVDMGEANMRQRRG